MDKSSLEKELNNIFRLYKACLDKDYLRELCNEKGLIKKANQIIENKKYILSFKKEYSDLLKNNASRYDKISLANNFNNNYFNKAGALQYKDELINKKHLEELDEDEKYLQEELDEHEEERGRDSDEEENKNIGKLDLGSSAVYQTAFEKEIEHALGLEWDPNFEFLDPDNAKDKIKGAYTFNGVAHLHYGKGKSIRDIGKKIYFMVGDAVSKLGLGSNQSIDTVDIAATVSKLVVFGTDTNEGSLIRDIQKAYDKAVSDKKLPLNISPFLMTVIDSRISDVLKSKSGYLKKLYDYYKLRERKKENKEEVDKLEESLGKINVNIEDIKKHLSAGYAQLKGDVEEKRKYKLKEYLRKYEEKIKNFNSLKENYSEAIKEIEGINKSINKEISQLESYIAKMNAGIEDTTGFEVSKRSPEIDSEGEFEDVYESVSKSFSMEDLFDEKILEKYKDFKEKFIKYYENLVNKKLLNIVKSNPNIITKNHIEDFVELAFDSVEISKSDDGDIINKSKNSIPSGHILEFKDDVIKVTKDLIKEIEKDSMSKTNFDDYIKDAIKKSETKFKKFIEEILPEKLIGEFLEFFKKNKLSTVSASKHELFSQILSIVFYQKDYENKPITIKDKQKIIDYLSLENEDNKISESSLRDLSQAVKLSLVNFATKSKGIDSKGYPKIIEKLYIWNLLPENSKDIVHMMNEEEKKKWEEDNTYVPERFEEKRKEYEKINKKQEKSDEEDSKIETELQRTKLDLSEAVKNLESLKSQHKYKLKNNQTSDLENNIQKAKDFLNKKTLAYFNALGSVIQRLDKEIQDLQKFSDKYDGEDNNILNLHKDLILRKTNFLLSLQKEQNEFGKKNKIKKEKETDLTVIPKEKKLKKVKKSSIEDITNYINVLYSKIL